MHDGKQLLVNETTPDISYDSRRHPNHQTCILYHAASNNGVVL